MSADKLKLDTPAPRINALARHTSQAILENNETDFEVESKADCMPVTAAETAAGAVITQGLSTIALIVPVVAEI